MDIFARAHRTLKALTNYLDVSSGGALPPRAPTLPALQPGEKLVGAYLNDPAASLDLVLFTTTGIYVFRADRWDHVAFNEIVRTVAPSNKDKASGFTLLLKDGSSFWLPVTGSKAGRFFDAFEVLRFIDRVVADSFSGA